MCLPGYFCSLVWKLQGRCPENSHGICRIYVQAHYYIFPEQDTIFLEQLSDTIKTAVEASSEFLYYVFSPICPDIMNTATQVYTVEMTGRFVYVKCDNIRQANELPAAEKALNMVSSAHVC